MKVKKNIFEFINNKKEINIKNILSNYVKLGSYEGILNIHRDDKHNIGDIKSAPYNYFNKLKSFEVLDIVGYKSIFGNRRIWINKIIKNKLVVGGGGLLNRTTFFNEMKLLEHLSSLGHKIVLWGIGHNNPNTFNISSYSIDLTKFRLVGVRDYNMGLEWVPCPSCMDVLFDKKFDVDRDISIILHQNDRYDKNKLNTLREFPILFNDETSFEKIIEFIGRTDVIITSSYHAMYWALLMGKKVVVLPNSSKMFSFKYKPTFCFDISEYKLAIKKANRYSGLLDECRSININFSQRVFEFLEI